MYEMKEFWGEKFESIYDHDVYRVSFLDVSCRGSFDW